MNWQVYWLIVGFAGGMVLAVAINMFRKAYIRRRMKRMFDNAPIIRKYQKKPSGETSTSKSSKMGPGPDTRKRIKEKKALDERESKVSEMLAEMRALILHLTDIISQTNSVTGEASERFDAAKKVLENLDADPDADLRQVKFILLSEVNKMVKSNATLKKQLVKAQTGMSNQKLEIDKLKTKAHIDTLTQLNNRSALDDKLRQMHAGWKHMQDVFAILMLDIDHFKKLNDTHGHVHGDRILGEIAAKIREAIRDKDFAARYGGEEFVVVFPDTPAEEALLVGTRIRESIERNHFQVDGNPLRITISGGIAQSWFGWAPVDIIDVADKALYKSKHMGRNRITLGEDRIKESYTSNSGL